MVFCPPPHLPLQQLILHKAARSLLLKARHILSLLVQISPALSCFPLPLCLWSNWPLSPSCSDLVTVSDFLAVPGTLQGPPYFRAVTLALVSVPTPTDCNSCFLPTTQQHGLLLDFSNVSPVQMSPYCRDRPRLVLTNE